MSNCHKRPKTKREKRFGERKTCAFSGDAFEDFMKVDLRKRTSRKQSLNQRVMFPTQFRHLFFKVLCVNRTSVWIKEESERMDESFILFLFFIFFMRREWREVMQ